MLLETKTEEAADPMVTKNADGSVTVKLSAPIESFGDKIDSLTLKQPTGKHWRRLNFDLLRSSGEEMAKIICGLGGITPSVFDTLLWPDISKLSQVVLSFFERSPPTPRT